MPADGTADTNEDFGTSRWELSIKLQQLSGRV
jgi:hypothetical protein